MTGIRITDAQEQKIKTLLEKDPFNAPYRILTEVLGDMDPPEGVRREFDEWSRILLYDGYKAKHFVKLLTTKYQ